MKNLINTSRLRPSTAPHTSLTSSTQSDRGRLLYSASFRRLQQKAQVFSLESNAAVRSRLTHSIEVSHVGRYLVSKISELLKTAEFESVVKKEHLEFWQDRILPISDIVETACLMHDIGNPPFGHFGESAIANWFTNNEIDDVIYRSLKVKDRDDKEIVSRLTSDFKYFDGNPQGFRIITKLQNSGTDQYGLNLTCTQLAAFLKYVYSPSTKEALESDRPFAKKIGFFDTEAQQILDVWKTLNMAPHTRHPLGYLMEASDDISYCISDIEDGIEKGIIQESTFIDFLENGLKEINNPSELTSRVLEKIQSPRDGLSSFLQTKTELINQLVKNTSEKFISNLNALIDGKHDQELINKGSESHSVLKILKDFTSLHIFTSAEAESIELAGYSIIKGLLNSFSPLLSLPKVSFDALVTKNNNFIKNNDLDIEKRLFNLLPNKHVSAYSIAIKVDENLESEWIHRAHLIVDYISGMTDNFALEVFQGLQGIKITTMR
jgi:dGTPase